MSMLMSTTLGIVSPSPSPTLAGEQLHVTVTTVSDVGVDQAFYPQSIMAAATTETNTNTNPGSTYMLFSCHDGNGSDVDVNDDTYSSSNSNDINSQEEDADIMDERFEAIMTNRSHLAQAADPFAVSNPYQESRTLPEPDYDYPVPIVRSNFVDFDHGSHNGLNAGPETEPGNCSQGENQNRHVIRVRKDVKLLKCRAEECYRVFTDRLQLISHSEMRHKIFMCHHCESVMLTSLERDNHYLKRHPEYAPFVNPRTIEMDVDISDATLTFPANFPVCDQVQSEHNYMTITPDDTDIDDLDHDHDDHDRHSVDSNSSHTIIDMEKLEEHNYNYPTVLSPVSTSASTDSTKRLSEDEVPVLQVMPESIARLKKPYYSREAFEIGNRANPIVLLEQIDFATLSRTDPFLSFPRALIEKSDRRYQFYDEKRSLPKKIETLRCSVCKGMFTKTLAYLQHRRACKAEGRLTVSVTPIYKSPIKKPESSSHVTSHRIPKALSTTLEKSTKTTKTSPKQIIAKNTKNNKVSQETKGSPPRKSKSIKCENCSRKFRNENSYLVHLQDDLCKKNNYIPMYKCKQCGQGFSRTVNLQHHIKSQHEINEEPVPAKLQLHRLYSDSPPKLECFLNDNNISLHRTKPAPIASGGNKPDKKRARSSTFDKKSNVYPKQKVYPIASVEKPSVTSAKNSSEHTRNKHIDQNVGHATMSEPRPRLDSKINNHERKKSTERNKHHCNECGTSFTAKEELAKHLLDHNEAKAKAKTNAKLAHQNQVLSTRQSETQQQKQNQTVKSAGVSSQQSRFSFLGTLYKCVVCGGGFRKRDDMVTHVASQHAREGIYGCIDCKKKFTFAADLVFHSQKHEDTYPFAKAKTKVSHSRKDSANPIRKTKTKVGNTVTQGLEFGSNAGSSNFTDTLFPCSGTNCNKKFASLSSLNFHRAKAHPESKFFLCPQPGCDIPFTHRLGLRRHLRDFHNITRQEKPPKPLKRGKNVKSRFSF